MKILCFHPALAPYRVDFFNLLARFAELKIVFLQENLLNQKFDQNSLSRKLQVPFEIWNGYKIKGQHLRLGVGRIIKRENPDVILGYESGLLMIQLILWRKIHSRQRIHLWTMLDDSPEQVCSRRGFRRIVRDWVMRNVDKAIVPSQAAAEAYAAQDRRFASGLFSVVPIIHDANSMRKNAREIYSLGKAWRRANCPETWNRVMLFVGRLAKEKNLHWLVEMMKDVADGFGLLIVGDGDERPSLVRQISELELDSRVRLVGRFEGDSLYGIISASDVLVLPSTLEPFGAVVAEGLILGTPCLVSDRCGAASLIEDGYNGCVFKCNDASSFKKAILQLPPRRGHSILRINLEDFVKHLIFS